jgi:uncharacterized protein YbaA (DUF1428 family)
MRRRLRASTYGETRDKGMEAMMNDPRMHPDKNPMPFDGERMIFGGFVPIMER